MSGINWRSRIVGHEKVDPITVKPNDWNHRTHPADQHEVVGDSLHELGIVKSVIINTTTGNLIDGHDRLTHALEARKADPSVVLDVEYVELTLEEERKALAILDREPPMRTSNENDELSQLLAQVTL